MASRFISECDCGDLLDTLERNRHKRGKQRDPKRKGECRAGNEIMRLPEREDKREPGGGQLHLEAAD